MRKVVRILLPTCAGASLLVNGVAAELERGENDRLQGLIGMYFSTNEFTNPKGIEPIDSLDQEWAEKEIGYGNWSAEWRGRISSPAEGSLRFEVAGNRPILFSFDGETLSDLGLGGGRAESVANVQKGESYPIVVRLTKEGSLGPVSLHILWSWEGRGFEPIPSTHLWYSDEEVNALQRDFPDVIEPPGRPAEVSAGEAQHKIVFYEPGRFGGWPANNGVWSWGNEILVGFLKGGYKESRVTHSIDVTRPETYVFARSLDGGDTWSIEEPEAFGQPEVQAVPCCAEPIEFSTSDFAFRSRDDRFYYSHDKGHTWKGPYLFPLLSGDLSSRTDYIVQGPNSCLFFLSAGVDWGELGTKDRALCAETRDGGKTFKTLGWMTSEPGVRSVMPSTVRVSNTELVSALRRREDKLLGGKATISNWLDAYRSRDNGTTWEFLSRIAETDTGKNNGNPPSLVRLSDGKLVAVYGYRATPYGMRARVSPDQGTTWGPEIALRSDARTWDFGYPRSVVRSDGRIVTVYYYTTAERPEQHIAATIWDPVNLVPLESDSRPAR